MKTHLTFTLEVEIMDLGALHGEYVMSINRVAMGLFNSFRRDGFQCHNMVYVLNAISGRAKPNIGLTVGSSPSIGM